MPAKQKKEKKEKDPIKFIREQTITDKNKETETESGKKTKKNITIDLDKATEILPTGEKVETSTKIYIPKEGSHKPTKEQKEKVKKAVRKVNKDVLENAIVAYNNPEPYYPEPDEPQPQEIINAIEKQTKKRGRPAKYSTEEEKKKMKSIQTLASNKRKRQERKASQSQIEGEGILEEISKVGKKIKKGVMKAVETAKDYGKAVIYGRMDYPPKVRNILEDNGNEIVSGLTIMRTPVPKVLTGALSLFSGGEFGKRMERAFDELFHLFLEIRTQSGKRLSVEKNEVINMDLNPVKRDKTETKVVGKIPSDMTIREMLDKTEEYMGKQKYYSYSAKDNNCQDFIVAIFKANEIGDESDISFIKQDTKQLFKDLPYLRKLSNTLTDLGSRVNIITTGAGLSQENYVVQSVIFSTDKWTTTKAKKWLKENNYKVPSVDKKEEHLRFRQSDPNKVESEGFTEYRTKPLGEDSGISLILAYKKNKISKKSIMPRQKKIKGSGAIPHQILVEREVLGEQPMFGGSCCHKCGRECDCMSGGKINIAGAFKKLGSTIKKGFTKDIINPVKKDIVAPAEKAIVPIEKQAGDYITAKKGGLATDLIKYGLPAVGSATLGGLATLASGGNPVAGVAASALGSKLGSLGATQLEKATGTGMKRQGRFPKGSQEAKDYMKMIRDRKGKK